MKALVSLRPVAADDLPVFFAHQLDAEATRLAAFPSRDREAFFAHWTTNILGNPAAVSRAILFGDRVAGNIGAWTDAGSGERLIGYWLGREFWGRGIASAAVLLLLRFESTRPLIARVAMHNLGSIRVLEKAGFTRVGEDVFSLPGPTPVEEIIYRLPAEDVGGTGLESGRNGPASVPKMKPTQLLRFPGSVKHDPAIEAWMNAHPGELGVLACHWFETMRTRGDDVRELLHDGHPTACIGDAGFGYVNAFKAHVNVGFFRGTALPDPERLLEGTGKFMRHVKLVPGLEPNAAALGKLIDAAYADMKTRVQAELRETAS